MAIAAPSKLRRTAWYLILFLPVVLALWVPLYNRIDPSFYGIPFFYWFQFILIVVAAAITAAAYRSKI